MAMIEVQHLQKNFVKTVKEPGLKGALHSFIHPEKQTFEEIGRASCRERVYVLV